MALLARSYRFVPVCFLQKHLSVPIANSGYMRSPKVSRALKLLSGNVVNVVAFFLFLGQLMDNAFVAP